jgi:hypothetical protein
MTGLSRGERIPQKGAEGDLSLISKNRSLCEADHTRLGLEILASSYRT